jgi:hypothetical protein
LLLSACTSGLDLISTSHVAPQFGSSWPHPLEGEVSHLQPGPANELPVVVGHAVGAAKVSESSHSRGAATGAIAACQQLVLRYQQDGNRFWMSNIQGHAARQTATRLLAFRYRRASHLLIYRIRTTGPRNGAFACSLLGVQHCYQLNLCCRWEHYVSEDLVHWTRLPPALIPTPGRVGIRAGCMALRQVTAPDALIGS